MPTLLICVIGQIAEKKQRLSSKKLAAEVPNEQLHFYIADRPADRGKFHMVGARGVFTSHRNVLELAIESKLQNVLVFEDDVAFRSITDVHIARIIAQLSEANWDLMFFGYTFPPDKKLPEGLIPWASQTLGTHFYAVTVLSWAACLNICESASRARLETLNAAQHQPTEFIIAFD